MSLVTLYTDLVCCLLVWTFPKDGEKQTFCVRGHTDWVNQVRLDMSSRTILSSSDGE